MTTEVLLSMEPEELAVHVLLDARSRVPRHQNGGMVHAGNDYIGILQRMLGGDPRQDPRGDEVELAFSEAWAWLEAQGLLVPAPGSNGTAGWRVLSRRARRFNSPADLVPFRIARMIDRDMLNPRIREEVWAAFMRAHFQVAAGVAMQAVETAVRDACGPLKDKAGKELYGKSLMGRAFEPATGPLANQGLPFPEQEGVRDLFTGAFGAHRNPLAHGRMAMDDAAEVVELLLLANHLLRIVDRAVARNAAAQPTE